MTTKKIEIKSHGILSVVIALLTLIFTVEPSVIEIISGYFVKDNGTPFNPGDFKESSDLSQNDIALEFKKVENNMYFFDLNIGSENESISLTGKLENGTQLYMVPVLDDINVPMWVELKLSKARDWNSLKGTIVKRFNDSERLAVIPISLESVRGPNNFDKSEYLLESGLK